VKTYLVGFFLALVVTLVLTPLVRRLAPAVGAVDLPSGRRVNKRQVPRLGGIAIIIGFLAPLVALFFYDNDISFEFRERVPRALALIVGSMLIAALGALDDLKGLRAWIKLLGQIAVAIGAFVAGYRIESITLPMVGTLEMGVFAGPITVLWIVGIINAMNLIDGLDGLAAGVACFACVVSFVVGIVSDYTLVSLFSAALGGALLGFLFFNFNPATIFMGDSGSMFIGYVLATSALVGSKGSTAVSLLVPVLALGVPIIDTLLAVVRRLVSGRSVVSPDRAHLHHRLIEMGFTHRRAVLLLYGISVLFTVAAIVVYIGREWQVGLTLFVASAVIVALVRSVRVFQFRRIRRMQRTGSYDEDTDAIRAALPELLTSVATAGNEPALRHEVEAFAGQAGLVLVNIEKGEGGERDAWVWEASGHPENGKRRGYVSATYPPEGEYRVQAKVKFGWFSDAGDVSPQSEVLLRVAAEAIQEQLDRLSQTKETKRVSGKSRLV